MGERFACSERFRNTLARMHRHDREQFLRAVEKFTNNPSLPGLNLEKMQGTEATYSIRASRGDRIMLGAYPKTGATGVAGVVKLKHAQPRRLCMAAGGTPAIVAGRRPPVRR